MLAELDAELGRSLSISASPDCVARVARAARDIGAAPARRWIPAPVWAGLAMAAAIVLAVWISQPPVTDSPRAADVGRRAAAPARTEDFRLKAEATQTQGRLTPTQEKPAVTRACQALLWVQACCGSRGCCGLEDCGGPGRLGVPLDPGRSRAPRPARPGASGARRNPPVIVEPSRALAIERLRELMTQGRLNEQMLPPPVTPEAALAELSIAPLAIAEITVPDVEIVGRPPAAPQRQ